MTKAHATDKTQYYLVVTRRNGDRWIAVSSWRREEVETALPALRELEDCVRLCIECEDDERGRS